MTSIRSLSEAVEVATRALEGRDTEGTGPDDVRRLVAYADSLRKGLSPWEGDPSDVTGYLQLAELFLTLGLRKESVDLTTLTLRNMRLAEKDGLVYQDPELWNHLGTLLARHGHPERAEACLQCALDRAHLAKPQEDPSIPANLSAISLQLGDLAAAGEWADRAAVLLRHDWERDLEARLTLDRVRLDLARARCDERALRAACDSLAESSERYAAREDADPSLVLAVSVALAAARNETDPDDSEIGELELLNVGAQLTLGLDHRETIIAQAALAAAEFDAAGGWSHTPEADNPRTRAAVETFDDAVARAKTSTTLGQDHPQTGILRTTLAEMRAAIAPESELPYLVDRRYLPDENDARNDAKKAALAQETEIIRLIAHGGASYLLEKNNLFYDSVMDALNRGVRFHMVIASPWNSLGSHLPKDEKADPASDANIDKRIESSDYYRDTFRPVTESYQQLEQRYPGLIELRLTNIDIPASILITSHRTFVESYITSNPNARTGKGMDFQESEFGRDSRFYATTLQQFRNEWGLASTWKEFEESQESHKDTLRSEMQAHDYVRLRESVRRGEVPRP
jgi:hypothetical protein